MENSLQTQKLTSGTHFLITLQIKHDNMNLNLTALPTFRKLYMDEDWQNQSAPK